MKLYLGRALITVLAVALLGLVVAVVYIVLVRTEGMDGMDGLALMAAVVVMPLAGIGFLAFLWMPLSLWWRRRRGRMAHPVALALGLALGLGVALIWGGMRGFTTHGSPPLFNFALLLLFALTALADNWINQSPDKNTT